LLAHKKYGIYRNVGVGTELFVMCDNLILRPLLMLMCNYDMKEIFTIDKVETSLAANITWFIKEKHFQTTHKGSH
jgi:hypothetical protein